MNKLPMKQARFVEEYLIDMNATQAAIRAGYSKNTAKSIGQRLLTFVDVKAAIDKRFEEIRTKNTATAQEVLEYLTKVLRGESEAEIVTVVGIGDGCSEVQHIQKSPDEREKLKAAEILAKTHGLLENKMRIEGGVQVVISGEEEIKD